MVLYDVQATDKGTAVVKLKFKGEIGKDQDRQTSGTILLVLRTHYALR